MFFLGMIGIKEVDKKRIIENGPGFIESDPVFRKVGGRFVLVPFIFHR